MRRPRGRPASAASTSRTQPVVVRVAQTSADAVLFGAGRATRAAAERGIERMRVALGVDQDLRPFHERFRFDPLIGAAVRADPGLRLGGAAGPLRSADLGDLRAADRVRARGRDPAAAGRRGYGRRCARSGLRDAPTARCDRRPRAGRAGRARPLAGPRAGARSAAPARSRRVASICWRPITSAGGGGCGRSRASAPGRSRRSRCSGQGRVDQLPAGDLAYIKLVGRLLTGDPVRAGDGGGRRGVLCAVRALGRSGGCVRAARRREPGGAADRRLSGAPRCLSGAAPRRDLTGLMGPWHPSGPATPDFTPPSTPSLPDSRRQLDLDRLPRGGRERAGQGRGRVDGRGQPLALVVDRHAARIAERPRLDDRDRARRRHPGASRP